MKHRIFQWIAVFALLASLCACAARTAPKEEMPTVCVGGIIYAPYFYRGIDGSFAGIDAELAVEAFSRLGYRVVFSEYTNEEAIAALESGEADCIWSCVTMEGKEDAYLWAGPYLYTQRVIIVAADSEIETLSDLAGKRLAVPSETTAERVLLEHTNSAIPQLERITTFSSVGEVFAALRKGYVDAIAGHESALHVYTDDYPGEYRDLTRSIRSEALGVAFQKGGNVTLAQQLAAVLEQMRDDGTTAEIIARYGLDVEKNVYGGSSNADTSAE